MSRKIRNKALASLAVIPGLVLALIVPSAGAESLPELPASNPDATIAYPIAAPSIPVPDPATSPTAAALQHVETLRGAGTVTVLDYHSVELGPSYSTGVVWQVRDSASEFVLALTAVVGTSTFLGAVGSSAVDPLQGTSFSFDMGNPSELTVIDQSNVALSGHDASRAQCLVVKAIWLGLIAKPLGFYYQLGLSGGEAIAGDNMCDGPVPLNIHWNGTQSNIKAMNMSSNPLGTDVVAYTLTVRGCDTTRSGGESCIPWTRTDTMQTVFQVEIDFSDGQSQQLTYGCSCMFLNPAMILHDVNRSRPGLYVYTVRVYHMNELTAGNYINSGNAKAYVAVS